MKSIVALCCLLRLLLLTASAQAETIKSTMDLEFQSLENNTIITYSVRDPSSPPLHSLAFQLSLKSIQGGSQ